MLRAAFAPRPKMNLLEWAEQRRWLSPEANAMAADAGGPVRYSTEATPYHRAPMLALSDRRTEFVICKFPSQDGKTEILNNFIGWRIDLQPGPILVLQPTGGLADAWSKDRLTPMVRDTPALRGKVRDARSRDSGNTILHKKFPGGHLTATGSNSPAGLSARPIQDVVVDEVDRCAKSAGTEGDSIRLAFRRATTFRRGKKLMISSPTMKGDSRIDAEYQLGTQEEWHVPCPHCGAFQFLKWGGRDTKYGMKWEAGKPETAHYICEANGCRIEEHHKAGMNARGDFIAQNPDAGPRVRSFWKNALTSGLVAWRKLVAEWISIQGKPMEIRQFVNTVLCELWEDDGESVDPDSLVARMEPYPVDPESGEELVPAGVGLLVRTADVQGDRLETMVLGFGAGQEAWVIDYELLPGDPSTPEPWRALAARIGKQYRHEGGALLTPATTFVDSGGHHTKEVYEFCRPRQGQHVYAIKGANTEGAPLLGRPTRNNSAKAILYMVGSFTAKENVTSRLNKVKQPGPGYIHLPDWLDSEQLQQLTNEKLVTRIVGGRAKRVWVKTGRNEFLDLLGYALAALHRSGPAVVNNLGQLVERVQQQGAALKAQQSAQSGTDAHPVARQPVRRGGWVQGWRR